MDEKEIITNREHRYHKKGKEEQSNKQQNKSCKHTHINNEEN